MQLVTLNELGFIQIPDNIRQQLRLNKDSKLILEIKNDQLVLSPIEDESNVYYKGKVLVADNDLLNDANTVIEELRLARDNEFISW